jgi:hypothetical protein
MMLTSLNSGMAIGANGALDLVAGGDSTWEMSTGNGGTETLTIQTSNSGTANLDIRPQNNLTLDTGGGSGDININGQNDVLIQPVNGVLLASGAGILNIESGIGGANALDIRSGGAAPGGAELNIASNGDLDIRTATLMTVTAQDELHTLSSSFQVDASGGMQLNTSGGTDIQLSVGTGDILFNSSNIDLSPTGVLNLKDSPALQMSGTQVVTTQQLAVANAVAAAGDPPTQAEFNALVTQFNALLARLRTHGLIAP